MSGLNRKGLLAARCLLPQTSFEIVVHSFFRLEFATVLSRFS